MKILGIETSCDDTAIAIIDNNKVLSNVVLTFDKDHIKYGGIVPEIASRNHADYLTVALKKALKEAKIDLNQINYIAYTKQPGLPGPLHTGKVFANTLACELKIPTIPIDHMIAHAFSFEIGNRTKISYPFICLNASGGNTIIYLFNSATKYYILNETKDDAVGECLDKIGRILDYKYPGGKSIDKHYKNKNANFKLIKHNLPSTNFSFSGLKTSIKDYTHKNKIKGIKINKKQIANSALKWCVDDLMLKTNYYLDCYKASALVVGGGFAANSLFRTRLSEINKKTFIVEKRYSGDNAAMIASYAKKLII